MNWHKFKLKLQYLHEEYNVQLLILNIISTMRKKLILAVTCRFIIFFKCSSTMYRHAFSPSVTHDSFSFCFQHYTPLHAASAGGQLSTLKQLLGQGALVMMMLQIN